MKEGVVLLHGLARSSRSMEPLRKRLLGDGFLVANLAYPSTQRCIEELATDLRPQIEAVSRDWERLHFVTHSMGGILVREMQARSPFPMLGRCVMLCPPNQGSQVVDRLKSWAPFRWLNGPAGSQLGTDAKSKPSQLGPVDFELGVIAGDRSINWILSAMLPGPNDGKVAVSHASVAGQVDLRVVHATHPLMMKNREVQENVLAFLRTGHFVVNGCSRR